MTGASCGMSRQLENVQVWVGVSGSTVKMGVENVSVLMPQLPRLASRSSVRFATIAAEFGANGTAAGSFVFHGPVGANPFVGWTVAGPLMGWAAWAGAEAAPN